MLPKIIRVSPILPVDSAWDRFSTGTFYLDGVLYQVSDYVPHNTLSYIPSSFNEVKITPQAIVDSLWDKFKE